MLPGLKSRLQQLGGAKEHDSGSLQSDSQLAKRFKIHLRWDKSHLTWSSAGTLTGHEAEQNSSHCKPFFAWPSQRCCAFRPAFPKHPSVKASRLPRWRPNAPGQKAAALLPSTALPPQPGKLPGIMQNVTSVLAVPKATALWLALRSQWGLFSSELAFG